MTKVIIALPGRTFSGSFLMNWTQTIMSLAKSGYQITVSNEFSSFVPFSRMKTLGLDVLRGSEQKPFGGTLEYDVWLTIDSDIVFTPEQVIELIEDTKKYPVVSGFVQNARYEALCVCERVGPRTTLNRLGPSNL